MAAEGDSRLLQMIIIIECKWKMFYFTVEDYVAFYNKTLMNTTHLLSLYLSNNIQVKEEMPFKPYLVFIAIVYYFLIN